MKSVGAANLGRWMKFNLVGAIGIGVQVSTLAVLTGILHLNYLLATALAVEAAVLHNFLWHERFTWADRASLSRGALLGRLLRFHAGNGAISICGNLLFMRLLVTQAHLPVLPSNLVSIALCGVLNFLVSDRLVFST